MLTLLATLIAFQLQPLGPTDTDTPTRPDTSLVPAARAPSVVGLEASPNRSVYKIHLAVDVPVTLAGAVVAGIRLFGTEKLIRPSCPCDRATLNPFDRSSVKYNNPSIQLVADVSLALIIATPIVLDLIDLGFSKPFFEDLMIFIETLALNTGVQAATALIVQRPRPSSYAGDPGIISRGEGYTSFYAGHVATTFAAMAVVSQTLRLRFGIKVWPWILTTALGTMMALERVGSGAHFPTDVIVGAVAGLAVGITVPWLHQRAPASQVRLVPARGGLGLAGQF